MKKVLIPSVIIIMLVVIGCAPTATTPAAGATTLEQETNQNSRLGTLETWRTEVQNTLNTISTQQAPNVTNLETKITELTTRLIAAETKITTLETKVTTLESGTTTTTTPGTTPTSPTGSVIFTNNPVSIPQIFSSSTGTSSNPWIMTISNQTNSWQYVKPVLNLNVASGQPSSIVTELTIMTSCGLCNLTGTYPTTPNNFSFSPTTMNTVATPSIVIIPISGCNGSGELQIGPGQSQALNVQIQGLKTPNPILWNVSTSISTRGM